MNGGRGAKGSINDRLISMMYRNRYSLAKQKAAGYTKDIKQQQKQYLKSLEDFDVKEDVTSLDDEDKKFVEQAIQEPTPELAEKPMEFSSNYQEQVGAVTAKVDHATTSSPSEISSSLHEASEKFLEVDLSTENFDFDHYDYYEILQQHTGIADYPEEEVIDVPQEIEKVEDEETILIELSDFIDQSKELLLEIEEEVQAIEKDVSETVTQEQSQNLEKRYLSLRKKINKLKAQYDTVKEKYNFEDFSILENIQLLDAIEDYGNKASLEEIEQLVDVTKQEIDEIDGIVIEQERSVHAGEKVEENRKEIVRRDEDFKHNQQGVLYLDSLEMQLSKESQEEAAMIAELEKKLNDFTVTTENVTQVVYHTERIFGSFLRIAAGILTVPFSGRHVFGIMLGTHLVNRGVQQLRNSLNPEFVQTTEVRTRYTDIEREILNSKEYVDTTFHLIEDSLEELDKFDEEFQNRFRDYVDIIPEYAKLEKQIETLKKRLLRKKEEVEHLEKDLERQYTENKVKVLRSS